ncbi:hypothetical protein J1N35_035138 [Gossypium stocksii]|uniref:MULE transposase domain-containing protein n=1 Tax=Gossypium stocksii TaxID=47602 RepID=A0A9D3UTH5_9ROSI|nr:hypothetical protein J1N35_035138 [Gossypium stocksii]
MFCRRIVNRQRRIQKLFAELTDVEPAKDPTQLGEEHRVQDPYGDDGYISSDLSDHKVDNNPDMDGVSNDIDDKGTNNDRNVNASLVENPIRCIVIHNNPGAHMSLINPYAVYATKFLKYHDILPPHWLAEYVPVTVIKLETRPYYGRNDQLQLGRRIFHWMFWTFDPCVRAFPYCKPLVQVDGTWLYGKYTQILLIVVAQDGNKNMLLIAFAIVDKENMKS